MRRAVLPLAIIMVIGVAVFFFVTNSNHPQAVTSDDWPQKRQNSQQSAHSASLAPIDPTIKWVYKSSGLYYPVVASGKVFACRVEGDSAQLLCLDAESGDEQWVTGQKAQVVKGPSVSGDSVIVAYVRVGLANTSVACYDFQGNLRWNTSLKSEVEDTGLFDPTIYNNKVYIVSRDTWVFCVNLDNGKTLWVTRLDEVNGDPHYPLKPRTPATLIDGKMYFSSLTVVDVQRLSMRGHFMLHCLDAATGEELWRADTVETFASNAQAGSHAPLVALGNLLYYSNNLPVLRAYDLSGGDGSWVKGMYATVTGAGGRVYASYEDTFYCFDEKGMKLWSIDGQPESQISLSGDGKLVYSVKGKYIDDGSGLIECIDTGSQKLDWSLTIDEPGRNVPALAYNRVYIGTANQIICLE